MFNHIDILDWVLAALAVIVLSFAITLVVIGITGITKEITRPERLLPCSEFADRRLNNIPARCVKEYTNVTPQ